MHGGTRRRLKTCATARLGALLTGVAAVMLATSTANAAQIISTTGVSHLTLGVNAKGEAMLTYTVDGKVVHVLAWGAINAIAPTQAEPQVAFKLAYDGGYQRYYTDNPTVQAALKTLRQIQGHERLEMGVNNTKQRYAMGHQIGAIYATLTRLRSAAENYWQTFTCPTYNGPALSDLVAACRAPDGSYWAVQSWDRDLPDYGVAPTTAQSQMEIHLAHWTGAIPVLTVHTDWAYGGQWNHLWGTYTYNGGGVYGFRSTPQGNPLDTFGRNLYVDTYDSAYGAGWRRENSFLTHDPGGSWCYSVNPHGSHPAGTGTEYRLTILGPGVTPDISVTVPTPNPYNRTAQAPDDTALQALHDPACIPHD